jgi:hypothetical protein
MTAPEVAEREEAQGTGLARATPPIRTTVVGAWDPFQMMDRFDEEALNKELEGRVADELVYVIKDGGQEVVGLSKAGVDECCMALVSQGQVIREEDLDFEIVGDGEEREALFKVKAARYGVSPTGVEVRLDQVIGVKRQPLYYEQAQDLTLDSPCPGKKYKGQTFRRVMEGGHDGDGRAYLEWMAQNFGDQALRDFVVRILDGEDPRVEPGRKKNPHWYEHGAMKAARNARFRLIPGTVRHKVMEMARASGRVRAAETTKPRQQAQPQGSLKGADPLDAVLNVKLPGRAGSWGGYAGKSLREISTEMLRRVATWAQDKAIEAGDAGRIEEKVRYEQAAAQCDLVIAAREAGQVPEPPHKDGTPREGKGPGPAPGSTNGGMAGPTPGGPTTAKTTGSTPTTSRPTQGEARELGEEG